MTAGDVFIVDPEAPERWSMSFLHAAEGCLRRAHNEREVDVSGEMATIGSIFHEVAATVGLRCNLTGEIQPSVAEVQAIAKQVMGDPEEAGPLSMQMLAEVLDLCGRWARQRSSRFQPGELLEIASREVLDGRTFSARIDRILLDGSLAIVRDYKTGWADPATELTFQGLNYAWHVFRRFPEVEVVRYGEDHIRFDHGTGPFEVDRDEMPAIEERLLVMARRIESAYADGGELPATPGSVCSKWGGCPVSASCPVPKWARPAGAIESRAEAEEQFEALLVEEASVKARKESIKGYLEATDQRSLAHEGEEIGWATKPGERFDKKGLIADLAVANGEPVDPDDYTSQTKPSFGRRKAPR